MFLHRTNRRVPASDQTADDGSTRPSGASGSGQSAQNQQSHCSRRANSFPCRNGFRSNHARSSTCLQAWQGLGTSRRRRMTGLCCFRATSCSRVHSRLIPQPCLRTPSRKPPSSCTAVGCTGRIRDSGNKGRNASFLRQRIQRFDHLLVRLPGRGGRSDHLGSLVLYNRNDLRLAKTPGDKLLVRGQLHPLSMGDAAWRFGGGLQIDNAALVIDQVNPATDENPADFAVDWHFDTLDTQLIEHGMKGCKQPNPLRRQ